MHYECGKAILLLFIISTTLQITYEISNHFHVCKKNCKFWCFYMFHLIMLMQTILFTIEQSRETSSILIINVFKSYSKDVRLPQQLQRAMAAEAEAAREARAKVIAAEGEHKSSRALAHAAEIISQTPAALQVRWFLDLLRIIDCWFLANSEEMKEIFCIDFYLQIDNCRI